MVSGTGRRAVAAAGVLAVATAGAVIARADEQSARIGADRGRARGHARRRSSARPPRAPRTSSRSPTTAGGADRQRQGAAVDAVVVRRSRARTAAARWAGSRSARSYFTLAAGAKRDVTVTLGGAPAGGSLYGALEVVGLPARRRRRARAS